MKWKAPLDKKFLPNVGHVTYTVPQDSVLEIYEPQQGTMLSVELFLQEGARVIYHTGHVQELSLTVTLAEQAFFEQTFSSKYAEKRKQFFMLLGKHSQVTVSGSYLLSAHALAIFEVIQLHKALNTISTVMLKTVLDDKAKFEYRGTITLKPEAQGSKAHQTNKNLIVSSHAQALSIPVLEALADDVQCGHGSAVSYVQEDHLFYLASRGIVQEQAKKMIVLGFLRI